MARVGHRGWQRRASGDGDAAGGWDDAVDFLGAAFEADEEVFVFSAADDGLPVESEERDGFRFEGIEIDAGDERIFDDVGLGGAAGAARVGGGLVGDVLEHGRDLDDVAGDGGVFGVGNLIAEEDAGQERAREGTGFLGGEVGVFAERGGDRTGGGDDGLGDLVIGAEGWRC